MNNYRIVLDIVFGFLILLAGFTAGAIVTDAKMSTHLNDQITSMKAEISALKEKETYLVGRLHAVHGIGSSECKDGKYYFLREGKKNNL